MKYSLASIDHIQLCFIIAQPRTGSSLFRNILNHHPQIIGIHEKHYFYFLYAKYHSITHWSRQDILNYVEDFYTFSKFNLENQFCSKADFIQLLTEYQKDLNYHRIIRLTALSFFPSKDKTSIDIIAFKCVEIEEYLQELKNIFPSDKFILLYRHPLDTIARQRHYFSIEKKKQVPIAQIALKWNYSYRMIFDKSKIIDESRQLHLFYEDLITNLLPSLQEVCRFLDIPYQSEMMQYKEDIPSASEIKIDHKYMIPLDEFIELHKGAFQEVDHEKINVWKKELTIKEAEIAWKICKDTALDIGYKPIPSIADTTYSFQYYLSSIRHFLLFNILMKIWLISPYFVRKTYRRLEHRR